MFLRTSTTALLILIITAMLAAPAYGDKVRSKMSVELQILDAARQSLRLNVTISLDPGELYPPPGLPSPAGTVRVESGFVGRIDQRTLIDTIPVVNGFATIDFVFPARRPNLNEFIATYSGDANYIENRRSAEYAVPYPVPSITGVKQYWFPGDGGASVLEIEGFDFWPESIVILEGLIKPSEYISANLLRTVGPGDRSLLAIGTVSVLNPDRPGGGRSQDHVVTFSSPQTALIEVTNVNGTATATGLTPRGDVAWNWHAVTGRDTSTTGYSSTKADDRGRAQIPTASANPNLVAVAAVDVTTGRVGVVRGNYAGRFVFPPGVLQGGRMEDGGTRLVFSSGSGFLLIWVRPGVGAWIDTDTGGTTWICSESKPLSSRFGPPPGSFKPEDVLVSVDFLLRVAVTRVSDLHPLVLPTQRLTSEDVVVPGESNFAVFTVRLDGGPSGEPTRVAYSAMGAVIPQPGTRSVTGIVTFLPGERIKQIAIPVDRSWYQQWIDLGLNTPDRPTRAGFDIFRAVIETSVPSRRRAVRR